MADEHIFQIIFEIEGATEPDEYAIRAYDSEQLEDILFGGPHPVGIFDADFIREAPRFEDAVLKAMNDIRQVFPEARLLEVKPDTLVTLADIAERMGRTHESVRLLAQGKRGPGGFPRAAGNRSRKTNVWRWHEVARWLEDELGVDAPEHRRAAFLAAVNDLLELQRVVPQVARTPEDARMLAALLPAELTSA